MRGKQLDLLLGDQDVSINAKLMSPREIWVILTSDLIPVFSEDRRVERKSCRSIDYEDISEYFSCFSNTPEGGVLLFGVANNGKIEGCSQLSSSQLNKIESFYRQFCPQSKPEFRRIPVDDKKEFIIAVYLPYVGSLVETNKQQAFRRCPYLC